MTLENLKEIASQNFSNWNAMLQTKDASRVADLYSDDATFLPTVSGEFKKGKAGAKDYFTHFIEKNPFGEVVDSEVQMIDNNTYLHSGMYNFEVDNKDLASEQKRVIVNARFTYLWQKNDQGKWEILHHHSSVRP